MNPESDHDHLWDLLGKARQPVVSPFFSRKIVREVRAQQEKAQQPGLLAWLLRYWQAPAMAACAIAIAGGALAHRESAQPSLARAEATLAMVPDFGVIGHLDELIDSEKNSVWLGGDSE